MKLKDILIAAVMSALWVGLSGLYVYKGDNLIVFGINLFPFLLWTLGLVILRTIYELMESKDKTLLIIAIYWLLLGVIEYIGYNIFQIQLASNYDGIFGLRALHVPTWAKIYYLAAGPTYIMLTEKIKGGNK